VHRLTPDQRSKQGAIWNKVPCKVRNWEIQVQFKVTGTTKASRSRAARRSSSVTTENEKYSYHIVNYYH
jgi:hypothetical protein